MLEKYPASSFSLREYAYTISLIGFQIQIQTKVPEVLTTDPHFFKAIELFKRALQVNPQDKIALFLYARTLEKMGMQETSEEMYLRALALDSNFTFILQGYGVLLNLKKNEAAATKFFTRCQSVLKGK